MDLIEQKTKTELTEYLPELAPMIKEVEAFLPELKRNQSLYGKSQSQYMDKTLTLTQLTPIRRLRQIAAECTKSMNAMNEAHGKILKSKAELAILERDYDNEKDPLQKNLLESELVIKENGISASRPYIAGAIKKIANYQKEYKSIADSFGLEGYTEEDFEKEEEKYHIMTAFNQGVMSARSRDGIIDEGNMIYLTQLGINGSAAQVQVKGHLNEEGKLIHSGVEPSIEMYLRFLENMADRFKGCTRRVNAYKGMNLEVNSEFTIGNGTN